MNNQNENILKMHIHEVDAKLNDFLPPDYILTNLIESEDAKLADTEHTEHSTTFNIEMVTEKAKQWLKDGREKAKNYRDQLNN